MTGSIPRRLAANIPPQGTLPRPDIHTHLPARSDGQPRVQGPVVAEAIGPDVLPKDDVALDGTERDAAIAGLVAVDEAAPGGVVVGDVEDGKICAAAGGALADADVAEEGGGALAAEAGGAVGGVDEPVGVEVVVLAGGVADELDGLEVGAGQAREALEGEGAGLDAPDDGVVEGDGGGGGGADAVADGGAVGGVDGGVGEGVAAARKSVRVGLKMRERERADMEGKKTLTRGGGGGRARLV